MAIMYSTIAGNVLASNRLNTSKSQFKKHALPTNNHRYRPSFTVCANSDSNSLQNAAAIDLTAAVKTLRQCGSSNRPPADEVEAALEKLAAVPKDVNGFPEGLNGSWLLVFAVPAPIPIWKYIPVREEIDVDTAAGTIVLKSWLGPFEFAFGGKARFVTDPSAGKYDMLFDLSSSKIKFNGKIIKQGQREPKQRTYSFFFLTQDVAAVKSSSSGGTTLMLKV